ncbi:hypothetical protein ACWGI1_00575 [Streptomyces sp. NPDC054835]|uniref:hypothetical protein n=1 Tax=Streptomyces exfoliatus TaxID=1905 RepID=UPI000463F170|nr:hypothetical protein [Streptomyces exfoliatus]
MTLRALLPRLTFRHRTPALDAEAIPGIILIAANLLGCTLTGSMIAHEINTAPVLGATSAPDLTSSEEQPPSAADATENAVRGANREAGA